MLDAFAKGQFFPVATGPYGLLGRGLWGAFPGLSPLDVAAAPPDFPPPVHPLPPVDIADCPALEKALAGAASAAAGRPIVLFHLAALTDTRGDQTALFEKVNVLGTENVLRACRTVGARMVHISTDYVFEAEGRADAPYAEDDRPGVPPRTAYSLSKYRAESLVLDGSREGEAVVARIAFPFGTTGPRPGLAEKYLQKMEECRRAGEPMRLFDDQRICPSYIPDIVRGLRSIAEKWAAGVAVPRVCHLVGEPTTPWAFGTLVRRVFGYEDVTVETSSVRGTRYAANLSLSTLKTRQALGWRPTPHAEALERFKAFRGPASR